MVRRSRPRRRTTSSTSSATSSGSIRDEGRLMSVAHAHVTIDRDALLRDIAARIPGRAGGRARLVWFVCMIVGLGSFVFLLTTQPLRAWGAYTINTLYWLGIAEGAIVLASAIRLANGRWGGPVMRVA